jgi:hypothetical protein
MTWGGNNPDIHRGPRVDHHRYNQFNRTSISGGNWRHDVEHRQGVAYRDQATASRFDRDFSGNAAAREQFRGRGATGARGDLGGGRLDSSGVGNRGAFDGVGNSAATRDVSSRGNASRAGMGSGFGGRGGGFGGGGRGGGRR